MGCKPDLDGLLDLTAVSSLDASKLEFCEYLEEARQYLLFYNWCEKIVGEYLGAFYDGILGIFLFKIQPSRPEIDEWIWVVVGDLPPTYLTCEECRTPAAALDGYIGAMEEWVEAALSGNSVAELIPVNVPASPKNAELLKTRLHFLDARIMPELEKRWPIQPTSG